MEELYKYMFWGDYNKRMEELAALSPEQWDFKGKTNNTILKNYMKHTFFKLQEENKIIETDDYCIFNTGLFTPLYEPIFVYGIINDENTPYKWQFDSFCTEYDLGALDIEETPHRANYFEDPSLLIFNVNCKINVQYSHILDDETNKDRIPISIKNNKNIAALFRGAVEMMKKKVTANYKIAVPQYYNGKIQLLLPLCLENEIVPDLALVVTKSDKGNFYQGHTCLTMEMAYNNARLIAKPESNWLMP